MSASDLRFIDTNILVYAYDISAQEKRERARALLEELWSNQTGCTSIQVLQEFYVTTTQKVTQPIGLEEAARIVRDLSYWHIHSPIVEDVLGAIQLQNDHPFSFWDAMILWSAKRLGCEIIFSEDMNPGQRYADVEIVNPFAAR